MKQRPLRIVRAFLCCLATVALSADLLQAAEPASVTTADRSASPHAVGFPSRDPSLDVLPGFRNPPHDYGMVPFYWWLGDRLTKERLAWQLDRLTEIDGIVGLQINYAHSDKGGFSYGLTYPSDPPLFSPAWWDLFVWWAGECNKRGIAVSLSDYTLGVPGQGWWMDEILHEDSTLRGSVLEAIVQPVPGEQELNLQLPETTLSVVAYRVANGTVEPGSGVDLHANLSGTTLRWKAPAGSWRIVAVHY